MILSVASGRWMEHWRNDAGREEPKQEEENLLQNHFVKHKSHIDRHRASVYIRGRKPMAGVPNVTRGTIFNGTLSDLKYSNYNIIYSSIIPIISHIYIKILNNQ